MEAIGNLNGHFRARGRQRYEDGVPDDHPRLVVCHKSAATSVRLRRQLGGPGVVSTAPEKNRSRRASSHRPFRNTRSGASSSSHTSRIVTEEPSRRRTSSRWTTMSTGVAPRCSRNLGDGLLMRSQHSRNEQGRASGLGRRPGAKTTLRRSQRPVVPDVSGGAGGQERLGRDDRGDSSLPRAASVAHTHSASAPGS